MGKADECQWKRQVDVSSLANLCVVLLQACMLSSLFEVLKDFERDLREVSVQYIPVLKCTQMQHIASSQKCGPSKEICYLQNH